jgi:hypothetical protein
MIDIRDIEIVTPDIERQVLQTSNNKLKTISAVLLTLLVISIAVYVHQNSNPDKNDEK